MRKLFARVSLVLAALALAGAAPRSSYPANDRIVAVGDLHGDFEAWRAIATAAGVTDARGRWTGGTTTLVQTGDVLDRGPDSLKIIRDLMRLQREARRAKGRVIMLVGNHEAMNMTADLRYVHPGEFAAFVDRGSAERREAVYAANRTKIEAALRGSNPSITAEAAKASWLQQMPLGKLEHQRAWSPDGQFGRWMIGNPAVAKIGETIFVHGGVSRAYSALPLDRINQAVADALRAQEVAETSIINDPTGPLWHRAYAVEGASSAPAVQQELHAVLQAYGARRMVIGHTPSPAGITQSFGGRLVRIDTAISRHYNGKLSYLEIRGTQLLTRSVPRPPGSSWSGE